MFILFPPGWLGWQRLFQRLCLDPNHLIIVRVENNGLHWCHYGINTAYKVQYREYILHLCLFKAPFDSPPTAEREGGREGGRERERERQGGELRQ